MVSAFVSSLPLTSPFPLFSPTNRSLCSLCSLRSLHLSHSSPPSPPDRIPAQNFTTTPSSIPPPLPPALPPGVPPSPPLSTNPSYTIHTWTFKSFRLNYATSHPPSTPPSAPALVLVHGFGANCEHWRRNLRPLAENGWRVYAPDLLGFGLGDKPKPGTLDSDGNPVVYNFDYWTLQLRHFVSQIVGDERPVFFVANSIGAMVTMQAAIEKPEICAAQVFISPSLRQLNVRKRSWVQDITAPTMMRMLNYRPLGAFFLQSLSKPQQLRRVLREAYAVKDAIDDDLVRIIREPALTLGALDVFLAFIMYDDGPIPEDFLPVLRQPSLVIWGEEDRFEPYILGEALRHYSTVDRFESLPLVGHCAHDEVPEICNKLITEFVQKHMARAAAFAERQLR